MMFLPSCVRISITVRLLYLDSTKTLGENATYKLCENAI